jgi:hypothetical protein
MSGDISVPCTLPWTLVRGEAKHTPSHWLDRSPLAQDELGRFSSEDRDERAIAIEACRRHLEDLRRHHDPLYEAPPRKRGRGRPRKG